MFRKTDVLLTVGCVVALGLSAAAALRPGAPLRGEIDAWLQARATRRILRRNWASLAASPDHLGGSAAAIRVVLFLDFECPYCRAEARVVDSALAGNPNVAIAVRQLPLPIHPAAEGAARAAVCAGAEGQFAAMATRLLADSGWQQDRNWTREALGAGVRDTTEFRRCLRAESTTQRLKTDLALAQQLGIHATPTFVTAHAVLPGSMSQARLRLALQP